MENTEPKKNSENKLTSDVLIVTKIVWEDDSISQETVTILETEVKDASSNKNVEIENKETPETKVESDAIGNSRSPGKDRDL